MSPYQYNRIENMGNKKASQRLNVDSNKQMSYIRHEQVNYLTDWKINALAS